MAVVTIRTDDDSRLDFFRMVKNRGLRGDGIMIVEGRFCVERCLDAGFEVAAILCENGRHGDIAASHERVPVFSAGRDLIGRIAGYDFHRGIMAAVRRPAPASIDDFLSSIPPEGPLGVVCVDRCASGENLGSIIRTAHAFGYHGVIASGSADPFSRRVIRVSAGSVFSVPVFEADDMAGVLGALRRVARCRLFAAVTDRGSTPFDRSAVPQRRAVLFGSEGAGLPDYLLGACDEAVHIPMADTIDSLNLAVAAGIILDRFRNGA